MAGFSFIYSGLIFLGAMDDEFVGRRQHWLDSVTALAQQGRLVPDDVWRVARACGARL